MSKQSASPTFSVLSASRIALSDQLEASHYWLRQRKVRIDTAKAQHIPAEAKTPERINFSLPGNPPFILYKLPDAVDRVLKVSVPVDLKDPLSSNGIYHSSFELFDNDGQDVQGFFKGLHREMRTNFNSSFVDIGDASIGLKDILNTAELYVAARRRQALESQISVTHPLTEASWRASVDGLIETLWALAPMVSFEPSWRLVDPASPRTANKIWEPDTIRPDMVLAFQVQNEPPPPQRQDILRAIGQDSRIYQYITAMQQVINTVETRCLAEFPTIDLSCLIVEYKKAPGSRHIRQLTMAMVTSLDHFHAMGLRGFEWPIFGLLIEASTATLYVGWMNDDCQVNVIDIWDHPQRYKVRGPAVFHLQHPFDALRFCCLLREIRWYGEQVATQVDEQLTVMYRSILTNFRERREVPKPHFWYGGSVGQRT